MFDGLSPSERSHLQRVSQQRHFQMDAQVLGAGQPCENVYVVLQGTLKICPELQSDSNDIAHNVVERGAVLGEISALDGGRHLAHVIALEPCALLCFPHHVFRECILSMPHLLFNIAENLAHHVRRLSAQNAMLATQNICARVAEQLLQYAERYGVTQEDGSILISVPLKQQTLASLVGASREKVNCALREYQNKGLVVLCSTHRILIRNPAGLREACEEHKRKRRQ